MPCSLHYYMTTLTYLTCPNIRSLHPTIQTLRSEGFRFCSHTALLHNRGHHGGGPSTLAANLWSSEIMTGSFRVRKQQRRIPYEKNRSYPYFRHRSACEIPTYLIKSSQLRGPALGVFWGPTHHKPDFWFTNCKSSGSLGIISHSHLGHIVLVDESRFSRYVSSYIQKIKGFPSACVNVCAWGSSSNITGIVLVKSGFKRHPKHFSPCSSFASLPTSFKTGYLPFNTHRIHGTSIFTYKFTTSTIHASEYSSPMDPMKCTINLQYTCR